MCAIKIWERKHTGMAGQTNELCAKQSGHNLLSKRNPYQNQIASSLFVPISEFFGRLLIEVTIKCETNYCFGVYYIRYRSVFFTNVHEMCNRSSWKCCQSQNRLLFLTFLGHRFAFAYCKLWTSSQYTHTHANIPSFCWFGAAATFLGNRLSFLKRWQQKREQIFLFRFVAPYRKSLFVFVRKCQ